MAVAFVVHASAWAFLCDDAFISFRYAENLAHHGELVFNPGLEPPERVEGYTNFAWVVLLSLPSALGIRPHVAAAMFTTLGAAAGLLAAVVLLRRLRGATTGVTPTDVVPAMLLVALPEYMVWAHGGLETSTAAALVLASMAAFAARRLVLAAGLAAAAGLTRPDALLPIAMFGLAVLAVDGVPRLVRDRAGTLAAIPRRELAIATAVFVLPLLAHLLFRRAYYGAWLPNTWSIKAHGALLRPTWGRAYVDAWVDHVHLVVLAPLVLLLRPRHAVLVAPITAVVAYGWWVGGDFMAYGRFYVVATGLLAVLVAWLLADAAALLHRVLGPRAIAIAPAAVGAILAAVLGREARARHAQDVERGPKWIDERWEGVTAMDRFAEVGLAAGTWMREHLPPDTWITVGAAGAVPYGAGLPTIDAYGLVDPTIASLPDAGPHATRPGHQLMAPKAYIESRAPDLVCHVGHRGSTRPRGLPRGWTHGYAWACMEPDPVGSLDPGFYCCLRPRDRVVGPFGKEPDA